MQRTHNTLIVFVALFQTFSLASMNMHRDNHDNNQAILDERQTYYVDECNKIDQQLKQSLPIIIDVMSSAHNQKDAIHRLHKKIDFYHTDILRQKKQALDYNDPYKLDTLIWKNLESYNVEKCNIITRENYAKNIQKTRWFS